MTDTTPGFLIPEPTCYRSRMTKDNKYRIGDGPREMPVWLRTEEPLWLTGLDEIPSG